MVEYGRCPKHATYAPPLTADRIESKRAYARRPWRKQRAALLSMKPVCEDCQRSLATEAHHTAKRTAGGGMELDNLKALCKTCHSRRTARGE